MCEQVTITRIPVTRITLEGKEGPFTCWLYGEDDDVYCSNDPLPKKRFFSFMDGISNIWSFSEIVLAFVCWIVGILISLRVYELSFPFFFTGWVCMEMAYLHFCGSGRQCVYAFICILIANNGHIYLFYRLRNTEYDSFPSWGIFIDTCFLIVSLVLSYARLWTALIQAIRQSLFLFWVWFLYLTSFSSTEFPMVQYIHGNVFRMIIWYLLLVVIVYVVISSLISFIIASERTDIPFFRKLKSRNNWALIIATAVLSLFCLYNSQVEYYYRYPFVYETSTVITLIGCNVLSFLFLMNAIIAASFKWRIWVIVSSSVMMILSIFFMICGSSELLISIFLLITGFLALCSGIWTYSLRKPTIIENKTFV